MQDIIFDLLCVGRFRQIYPEVSDVFKIVYLFTSIYYPKGIITIIYE